MFRLFISFILISFNLCGQNQFKADSLIQVYNKNNASDSLKLKILDKISFNHSNPDEIIRFANLLLKKAEEQKSSNFIYNAYAHLGDAFRLKGDYDLAFQQYFKALEHAESNNLKNSIGTAYCTIGDTYATIGDLKNAQLFYGRCIDQLKNHGNSLQLATALLNSGDNLLSQNKVDSSLIYFQQASKIFNELEYAPGQAYSLGNTGLAYARQGKNELAEETLKAAIQSLEKLGDAYAVAAYLIHMVDVYIEKEELWLSLEYANMAFNYASEMGYKEQIKDASLRLSRIYEKMSKAGEALDYLKTYVAYKDSLKNESIISRMSELRREYELAQIRKKANERKVANEEKEKRINKPNYYALFLGVNDYKYNDAKLTDLNQPVKDAELLYHTLTANYNFDDDKMVLIANPGRADIINSLEAISATITDKDNLLIFYAGHGVWDEKLNIGYWLPGDAKSDSKANWISNSTIRDYISGLPAKHTLLISDACFSGGIFKTRALSNGLDGYGFSKLYKLPSRKAMTSGTLTTVPDDSQFMKYLIKYLAENKEDYLSARQLFAAIETAIINNSSSVPQYGTIQNAGDEGGEFIFIRKEGLPLN